MHSRRTNNHIAGRCCTFDLVGRASREKPVVFLVVLNPQHGSCPGLHHLPEELHQSANAILEVDVVLSTGH